MTQHVAWLEGCATALVTPFNSGGAIDERALRALVARQVAGGVRTLVAYGTTGEGATLADCEKRRVLEITLDESAGRARVLAGTGSNSTGSAVRASVEARAIGADGLLVVSPYYNNPTHEGISAHYAAIADAVGDLPIVVYNVPGRTACNISSTTLLRLAAAHDNIVGVKEASGNMQQIGRLLSDRPPHFKLLSGDDALTLPLLALGADGVISVVSNETPELMTALVEAAFAGEWVRARQIHFRLLPLMEANFLESNPAPVKAALALMGLIDDTVRLPLVRVRDETCTRLRDTLVDLGLGLFDDEERNVA